MKLSRFYQFVEEKIGNAFARYGRFVSRHAWKVVFMTILVNGLLGIGMMGMKSDIEVTNVYLPMGTRSREDTARVQAIFPDLSGSNFSTISRNTIDRKYAEVIVAPSTSGSLLNKTLLEEIRKLDTMIQEVEVTDDNGETIKFSDICTKLNGACAVDTDMFWSQEFLDAVDLNKISYPIFIYAGKANRYTNKVGDIRTDGQYLQYAGFIRLQYFLRSDDSTFRKQADSWVQGFQEAMDGYSSGLLNTAHSHHHSLDKEVDRNIKGDIKFFSLTITLMLTYACLATLSNRISDNVGQRMWLGWAGILATGLAIVGCFGLVAGAGVDFVSIVGVMPFLILGIGIDDMFILLSGLSGAQTKLNVEDRIAETMRASGVGITITTLTDFIAFMAGAASNFIAVRNFCIYTGVGVVFCYVNNITLFAACMTINERRVFDSRHYVTCRRIKTKEELRSEGQSKRTIFCCGGRAPTSREEAESFLDKFPRWLLPKIVLKKPFKIIIVIAFMAYLAAGIYGCVHLKQGLQFTQLVSEKSYYYKFASWQEKYFKRQTPVSFVTEYPYTYSDPMTQSLMDDLVSQTQADPYFDPTFEVNWRKVYALSKYYDDSSEDNFLTGLKNFLADPTYARFNNDVVFDDTMTRIRASRIYVMSADQPDSQAEGKMMLRSREIADNAAFKCYAFSPFFVAYEQFVAILGQTLQSVGIALVAVFIVTCLFMPHPVLIVFTTVAVTMIMVGVFGFLIYLDVALSSITMIHLIMSIGFSIDFTAHICHGYMISDGETRDIRVKQSIDKTGAPIFHGFVSSILGIIVLVAARSYIFRTFATVMAFVLIFGIAHALLLLPVVLSWFGPGRINQSKDSKENGSAKRSSKTIDNNEKTPSEIETGNGVLNGGFNTQTESRESGLPAKPGSEMSESFNIMEFGEKSKPYKLEHIDNNDGVAWKED